MSNPFPCQEVYKTLSEAKAAGDFSTCLEWDISNAKVFKRDKISVTYINLKYTNYDGRKGRLIIDAFDEINQGSIMPVLDDDVAEINALNADRKFGKVESRDKDKPTIKIKKYTTRIKSVDNNGIQLAEGEVLPGEDSESLLFKTLELYNEAFNGFFESLVENKTVCMSGDKKKAKGALLIQNVSIKSMIYDTISELNTDHPYAGHKILNPSAKLQLKHDYQNDAFDHPAEKKSLLQRKTRILDYDTGNLAMLDGEPVKNTNVHKYVVYNCKFNAMIDLGNACCSSAGISNPIVVLAIAVKQPEARQFTMDLFSQLVATKAQTDEEVVPQVLPTRCSDVVDDESIEIMKALAL